MGSELARNHGAHIVVRVGIPCFCEYVHEAIIIKMCEMD
jgi:hypothetical protein